MSIRNKTLSKSNKNEHFLFQKCSSQLCLFRRRFYANQIKVTVYFFENVLARYVYSSGAFSQIKQKRTFTLSKIFQLALCIPRDILSKLFKNQRLLFQKCFSQLSLFLLRLYPSQTKTNVSFFKIVLASYLYSS